MATLVDTAAALDLNKDDPAELKRQRVERQEAPPATKTKGEKKALTERRDTENKGQGLFATQSIETDAIVARQPPALSVVFDAHSQTVCGFCFKPDTTDKKTVKLVKRDGKVGVVFADDEHGAAVVTRLSATGANSTADIKTRRRAHWCPRCVSSDDQSSIRSAAERPCCVRGRLHPPIFVDLSGLRPLRHL